MNHHYSNILKAKARLTHQGAYNHTKGGKAESREIKTDKANKYLLENLFRNSAVETNWFINKKLAYWKYGADR